MIVSRKLPCNERQGSGTVDEVFELATESVNQDAPADKSLSTKTISVKEARVTARSTATEAKSVSFIAEETQVVEKQSARWV